MTDVTLELLEFQEEQPLEQTHKVNTDIVSKRLKNLGGFILKLINNKDGSVFFSCLTSSSAEEGILKEIPREPFLRELNNRIFERKTTIKQNYVQEILDAEFKKSIETLEVIKVGHVYLFKDHRK
ncbi:MAG: hypothetical protein KKF50_02280 [Nanoarchaeota archaeon]|nr:hypothetical protein [Nanoarchaeota archaeon]